MDKDLYAVFQQLATPLVDAANAECFNALPVGGTGHWHIGKSADGLPALIGTADGSYEGGRLLAVKLENLRVQHHVRCSLVRSDGDVETAKYSIVQCLSHDVEVQQRFVRTIGSALLGLDSHVAVRDLNRLIDQLVVLFQLMRQPATRTMRGLWAELFVILRSSDPPRMIDAWHGQPGEHFDFSQGANRLEVKASSSRSRNHVFSLEQVYPPSGATALVASIHVEDQTSGSSLGELWDRAVDTAPTADARLKVERVCVQALGRDLRVGRSFSADWKVAVDSLAFFCVSDIPRPPAEVPRGVSQLRFRSDLSIAEPVKATRLDAFHRCCLGLVALPGGARH